MGQVYLISMTAAAAPKLMTADEFFELSHELGRCELIQGVVNKMTPPGGNHGRISNDLCYYVNQYVRQQTRGQVYAAETGFVLGPSETVRAPDLAYIAADRVDQARTHRYIPIPPDLAVEVNSPHDRASDVAEKTRWWLTHGTRAVWIVDPATRSITVHRPDNTARTYTDNQILDGGEVLPGFTLVVRTVFDD